VQREVEVIVDGAIVEALSDALIDAGALSVAVEDADANRAGEIPLYGEPGLEPVSRAWCRSRLTFMMDAGDDGASILAAASAAILQPAPAITSVRDVGAADWVRVTQAQFPPMQLDDLLWIVPTWHEPPDPAAINIRLDPGVAFGTGTHPTTRLCLQWLARSDLSHADVLDYGCGSGILAIAAAKLGARTVVGTDIDARALDAARANSAINCVNARYTLPQELGCGTYDVVLANILAMPLLILAPALVARVAPGGHIVLSGILDRQVREVIDTYAGVTDELSLSVWRSEEGWSCVVGARQR
jgi:ribosomal protein L11 methyltransferase